MSNPFEDTSASGALDSLVSQFSSVLDCYRELVQNSMDAGSPTIDVWLEYIEGESSTGTIAIHIDDYGEGMNEAIIDGQLTKLFSSTKENDLTKIGKFGIGFVSVFALQPRAVLIQTGRGGEYWEILFHEDRSFSKSAIDSPVEGTQITIFIEDDRHRYNELVFDSRKTLKHWCAHSETEITFEDRSDLDRDGPEVINQPLKLDGHCLTSVGIPGTDMVLAYQPEPLYGFYNKGLTLLQTRDAFQALGDLSDRMKYIGVKIKSRYLEHTLSRETILKDKNYEKAIALVREAADGQLFEVLVSRLEELAAIEQPNMAEYLALLGVLELW